MFNYIYLSKFKAIKDVKPMAIPKVFIFAKTR